MRLTFPTTSRMRDYPRITIPATRTTRIIRGACHTSTPWKTSGMMQPPALFHQSSSPSTLTMRADKTLAVRTQAGFRISYWTSSRSTGCFPTTISEGAVTSTMQQLPASRRYRTAGSRPSSPTLQITFTTLRITARPLSIHTRKVTTNKRK